MNASAVVTMFVICGFVWGGFLILLSRALASERAAEIMSLKRRGRHG